MLIADRERMGVAESYGKWQRLDVRIYANAVVHAARMPLVTRICNNVQQTPAVTRARRFARYGDPRDAHNFGRAKAGSARRRRRHGIGKRCTIER